MKREGEEKEEGIRFRFICNSIKALSLCWCVCVRVSVNVCMSVCGFRLLIFWRLGIPVVQTLQ